MASGSRPGGGALERRPLMLSLRVPRSYGSLFTYHRFVRGAVNESTIQESLHRSESMLSLACFRTLSGLVNDDNTSGLQSYLATNKNALVDDRDENGTTALMVACEAGRGAAARLLLGAGADPGASDADGWTPLAHCARAARLGIARDLLDAGAPVDPRDVGGWTPLMWAAYKGAEELVALLLERGADVHAHGDYHVTSLVWAAGRKHTDVVRRLLAAGARPTSSDKYATSALTWAARAGDAAACAALLQAGADPSTAGMYCWTPLLQATQGNHFEIVQMLLEHKPNVNALDKDGYTALAIACKEGFYDIAVALISAGAYINVQDHSKDTCLIHAVKGGHKNIVESLLKKHVDVDLPGKEKKTPVYTAVEKGHVSVLRLLLASNPDLELTTNTGDTPLLRAVRSRSAEMVQLLLERKARVGVADHRGDTALHVAMRARSKQIIEILLRNPKNSQMLYKPNKAGETPYNIDMGYPKTILGQIFGARKLNTNEDNENMLGYELYSSALADMLAEPSLSVPITVGLYARWGSGKSFLLNKLKEEMKNFARQWAETGWAWSWAVAWAAWHAALAAGACVAAAGAPPVSALAVCFALFLLIYLALYLLWYLGNRYEWWWAAGVLSALGSRFSSLLLVLQVVFCHPPGPNNPHVLPAMPIRFHFTEGAKSSGQEGSASVVQMMASLAEALESQYGRVCTRLARAFRPKPLSSTSSWKWRRVCCLPHIVTFELCFTCLLLGACVLILYLTENTDDPQRREIQQGLVIGAGALAGVALLANLYTWGRVLGALALGPRARMTRALAREAPTIALRPEVLALTEVVACLDAFTGQQTRLVVVVDALDSCEQERVLTLLNAINALCSHPHSPFILLLAIDPHIISKAVEASSRRAFSESNIGGWDYLRNMVQLPFYLQNSALRRVKVAQQTAQRRMANEDFSTSLQRSVSARRLSSTSELMSSQERIKPVKESAAAARARRLRPSDSVASSVASGLHRAGAPTAGAADLSRVLLTDDYFSDVNPRSMRRLMNVLYITGRLLKAFQIDFNWYQLASWVNLTEQWPFRTSWIIYHHETYEEHIDDSTSLKHIYDKIKPSIPVLRDAEPLMELDRDERKLEVFLNFHRSTLLAADLKIFLPFTINLDPYIKKLIKEDQQQHGQGLGDEVAGGTPAWQSTPHPRLPHSKLFQRKQKPVPPPPPMALGQQPMWVGWTNAGQTSSGFGPSPFTAPGAYGPGPQPQHAARNPLALLRAGFPGLGDASGMRLSSLSVERVCGLAREALGAVAVGACAALQRHHICGMVLAHCDLPDLKQVLDLPFGDWEMFKMLVLSLRDLEATMPLLAPTVTVVPDKVVEPEREATKPHSKMDTQRSRPSNVEKQVTLEEQMICGALQTLNEEALEDVLHSEPPASHPDEEDELQLRLGVGAWAGSAPPSPAGTPLLARRDPSILKPGGSFRKTRRPPGEPPAVTFNVENEEDSDEGQITFSVPSRSVTPVAQYRATAHSALYDQNSKHDDPLRRGSSRAVAQASIKSNSGARARPASLLVTLDDLTVQTENGLLSSRSRSVEDSTKNNSPITDLKIRNIRKTSEILKKVSSSEKLTRFKEKILSRSGSSSDRSPARLTSEGPLSDDESAPLVAAPDGCPTPASEGSTPPGPSTHSTSAINSPSKKTLSQSHTGAESVDYSFTDSTLSTDFSPCSERSVFESPKDMDFDMLPNDKTDSGSNKPKKQSGPIVERVESVTSISNMLEPYNMRLLARGASDGSLRAMLWRQDALDAEPSWSDPDSAV